MTTGGPHQSGSCSTPFSPWSCWQGASNKKDPGQGGATTCLPFLPPERDQSILALEAPGEGGECVSCIFGNTEAWQAGILTAVPGREEEPEARSRTVSPTSQSQCPGLHHPGLVPRDPCEGLVGYGFTVGGKAGGYPGAHLG